MQGAQIVANIKTIAMKKGVKLLQLYNDCEISPRRAVPMEDLEDESFGAKFGANRSLSRSICCHFYFLT